MVNSIFQKVHILKDLSETQANQELQAYSTISGGRAKIPYFVLIVPLTLQIVSSYL
jgi:hypothetical protein